MAGCEDVPRRTCIPILHTRGTHFEVGLDIGRTFQANIETFMSTNDHLNNVLVEKYQSAKVRRIYEKLLHNATETFPHFVDELKGISQGARVPFFKVFLMHVDDVISSICGKEPYGGMLGSTTICCDQENKVFLGHSQDFSPDSINLGYVVSAHILEAAPRGRYGVSEEKFSAFCLPGMLPGLFMGYNYYGMVFSINTISTGKISVNRTPRHFLCRALLTCSNMFDAMEIVQDEGQGISDGMSVNMIFCQQEGAPLFHNAEVAPPANEATLESQVSVLTLSPGECLTHCNKFLRVKADQSDHLPLWSSNHRHAVLGLLPRVESVSNVVAILGDQTDVMFSFFRDGGGKDQARTIVIGIFNLVKLTWSLYTQNPKNALPVVVLPLALK
ncbi:beta-alanyl-dopamine/carcinine hydrolase-like [Tigriopus californicus]|uniref:beta-alanyl-dopamine/carcinine hydrolase-like n=1 Tax=Tigriopus californicus TaxID=6832 RepID=UPI0027DA66CE|nr:beta-alanyl-dopamine/carcinine hydrolase-like [Tigriopus californicus]